MASTRFQCFPAGFIALTTGCKHWDESKGEVGIAHARREWLLLSAGLRDSLRHQSKTPRERVDSCVL